jgi:hypothetical protein
LAYAHGVFPLVYKTLKNYEELIPQNILHSMKKYNMEIAKENMLMTAELIKVMQLLEQNGIEAIAFKGPTLAQMAYGDITLRQYSDLDILIHKKDVYKVYTLLKNNYIRSLKLTPSQEKIWLKYAHDLGLTGKNGIHTEFHWSMLDSDHPVNLQKINFFAHQQVVKINNAEIAIISNEIFLLYLCIHGSKHMFERIEWIVDIDKFVRANEIDWKKFQTLVEGKNYSNFVHLGLYLAKNILNTSIPTELQYINKKVLKVYHYILDVLNTHAEAKNSTNIKFMLQLFTSKRDTIQFIHKMYFKPTFSEYWYVNLPGSLYFFYYPIRQYLLIKKYLFKSNN